MRRRLLLMLTSAFLLQVAVAQEKLLYSTNFQDWTSIAPSATETSVLKKTDFSLEDLTFKFYQVGVSPTGWDATRFDNPPATPGYAQAAKAPGSYIELSPLNHITKVVYIHGATGGNRGYKVWKKGTADATWVLLYSTPATPARGQVVTVNINESNVAVKFTNIDDAQNAYMFDLKIYGNYVSANPQHRFVTNMTPASAGTITRTPNSDMYDQGTTVSLQAIPNFGYRFVKWIDSLGVDLSTANPLSVSVDAPKNITAVFTAVNTYSFNVNIVGSQWGELKLSPLPTNGRYEEGTVVTMQVVPNPVTNFSYWEDNSTSPQRFITVNQDINLTATFDEIPFIVGWNFKAQTPTVSRSGDFYTETTNTGLISSYDNNGNPIGWLANAGSFSPALPNIRLWTPGADFKTKRRYIKANFSTVGYKNIQVKSLVTANYQAYSVQTLQYSLNDTTYQEVARVDITSVYNTAWKELNATLPADANGKTKIYLRWVADETSPILGNAADNDGTAYTNIFVYADKETIADSTAPVLVSTVPVNGSSTASVNGTIVLTFNERVKAGTGNITLGSKILTPSFGSKTATLPYEKLSYNTQYTLTVPAGAITDASGNAYGDTVITFSTGARTQPVKQLFDAVVAKDGSGNYTSIIDAIAAAPASRTQPWLIYIKNGKYTGHHEIPATKPFIHLIGQSRDSVIISDDRLAGEDGDPTTPTYHVSLGATMVVNASDVYFENITLENSWGVTKQAGPQALALYSNGDRFTTNNCYMRSYQDTYLTTTGDMQNRHYLKKTKIEGAVDFIYGAGDVFFDQCTITQTRNSGGYIVAPSHPVGTLWGYVFSNCTINEAYTTGATSYFGRPWQGAPKTVFLNTKLLTGIYPVGWHYKMGAIPAVFADYNTMDANGNPVDLSQRIEDYQYDRTNPDGSTTTVHGKAKKSLTDAEAATYTYENVMLRSGSTWDPRMMAEAPEQPISAAINGNTINWNSVPYARLYIVFRNAQVLGFTIDTTYTDTAFVSGALYAVQAVSEYGALSAATQAVAGVLPVRLVELTANANSTGSVDVQWSTANEKNTERFNVERSLNGREFKAVGSVKAAGNSIAIQQYMFVDDDARTLTNAVAFYRLSIVDKDGSKELSHVVKVALQKRKASVSFSPNPVRDLLLVSVKESGSAFSLRVVDANGKQVYQQHFAAGSTNEVINTSTWQHGLYLLQIITATETNTYKILK